MDHRHSNRPQPTYNTNDGLSSSDESAVQGTGRGGSNWNGSKQRKNANYQPEGTSSPTSVSEDDDLSEIGEDETPMDPIVSQEVLNYMIQTRKRHIRAQRKLINRHNMTSMLRHNLFFACHPEFKRKPYILNDRRHDGNAGSNSQNNQYKQQRQAQWPQDHLSQSSYLYSNANQTKVDGMHSNAINLSRNNLTVDKPSAIPFLQSNPNPAIPSSLDKHTIKHWEEAVNLIPTLLHQKNLSSISKLSMCRNMAILCQREVRKATYRKLKHTRDVPNKARRATREMLTFWRRNEKDEREARKRAEREALEKQRLEEEAREAKRQERKLNFLITQTELYGHFVSKRLEGNVAKQSEEAEGDGQGEGVIDFKQVDFDADDQDLEAQAKLSAQQALKLQSERTRQFDEGARRRQEEGHAEMGIQPNDADQLNFQDPSTMQEGFNVRQPKMLTCELKSYQLKGLNWLANLYEQGINGILADEMGLGKTVQSISLLAHLAEAHNIWGPFLVVAPASTLHNWQQEVTKFAPSLKTLPYWGSIKDRKVLRKFWSQKQLYTKDAPFHVLITSYQLILTDEKYFQRIKWQYMILDEAQAIKSSASNRWKALLNFHCRNRLLLTGTPIQNSMQELWALLHFIMPSLFDSHEEFSEWFSKDIENHAEKNGELNQHQLKRLHMILKPFMLRRVKKHVQHELGDKIELEIKCELTPRQRQLYASLREKISLSELLEKSKSSLENESVESLMNLVIQFRKVCNHPELFERAEVKSPLAFCLPSTSAPSNDLPYIAYHPKPHIEMVLPKLFYLQGGLLNEVNGYSGFGLKQKLTKHELGLWSVDRLYETLTQGDNSELGCLSLTGLSAGEIAKVVKLNLAMLSELDAKEKKQSFYHHLRQVLDVEASKVELMTPQSLLKDLRAFNDITHISKDYFLFAQAHKFTNCYHPSVVAPPAQLTCSNVSFLNKQRTIALKSQTRAALLGQPCRYERRDVDFACSFPSDDSNGFSFITVPDPAKLMMTSGKLMALDKLLTKLKAEGHRVLLYFQMTKMIDLMEEFLTYRQHSYLRLDGSSRIADRRDLVNDWQTRPDLFIFLLSTRAGGLGINLTAADTVIFYDSDWNPTVDQQAMDRAHRLGQTKQVTVYRLVTMNTIEERILIRAKQKDAIHRVVIAGGDYKQELKSKEIFSLLLDEEKGESSEEVKEGENEEAKPPLIEVISEGQQENKVNTNGDKKRKVIDEDDVIKEENNTIEEETIEGASLPTSPSKKVRVE